MLGVLTPRSGTCRAGFDHLETGCIGSYRSDFRHFNRRIAADSGALLRCPATGSIDAYRRTFTPRAAPGCVMMRNTFTPRVASRTVAYRRTFTGEHAP